MEKVDDQNWILKNNNNKIKKIKKIYFYYYFVYFITELLHLFFIYFSGINISELFKIMYKL